jgi:hypothetical protein
MFFFRALVNKAIPPFPKSCTQLFPLPLWQKAVHFLEIVSGFGNTFLEKADIYSGDAAGSAASSALGPGVTAEEVGRQ